MKARYPLLLALLGIGCGGADGTFESTAETSLALNACDETAPASRSVDGLPAYAQCDAVSSGDIWSNNGVDTSTSSLGSDWVETQRGGGYQCTEWAYRYMHFRWGVDYRHGDARQWCDGMLPSTLVKATAPSHGDLIVFDAGVCGADATTGHIAVIDAVDAAAGKVTIVEENEAGRRTTNQSCGSCFLHALANDGSNGGAAGTSGGGQAGGGGAKASGSAGSSGGANGGAAMGGRSVGAGRGGGGSAGTAAAGIGGAPTTSVGGAGVSAGAGGVERMPGGLGGAQGSSGIAGSSAVSSAGVSAGGATATSASSGGSGGWASTAAGALSIDAVSESPSAGCNIGSRALDHSDRRVSSALLLLLFGIVRSRRGGASHRAMHRHAK